MHLAAADQKRVARQVRQHNEPLQQAAGSRQQAELLCGIEIELLIDDSETVRSHTAAMQAARVKMAHECTRSITYTSDCAP